MSSPVSSSTAHQVTIGNITYEPELTYWGGLHYRVIRMEADPDSGAIFAEGTFTVGEVYTLNKIAYETLKQFREASAQLPAMITNIGTLEQAGRRIQKERHISSWVCTLLSIMGRFFCDKGWYYDRSKALKQALLDVSKRTVAKQDPPKRPTVSDSVDKAPSPSEKTSPPSSRGAQAALSTPPKIAPVIFTPQEVAKQPYDHRAAWIASWNHGMPRILEKAASRLTQHPSADKPLIWHPEGKAFAYKLYYQPLTPPMLCIEPVDPSQAKQGALALWCDDASICLTYRDLTGEVLLGSLNEAFDSNEIVALLVLLEQWSKTPMKP